MRCIEFYFLSRLHLLINGDFFSLQDKRHLIQWYLYYVRAPNIPTIMMAKLEKGTHIIYTTSYKLFIYIYIDILYNVCLCKYICHCTHYTLGGVYRKLSCIHVYTYYYNIVRIYIYIKHLRFTKVYWAHARAQSDLTIGPLGLSRRKYDNINNNTHTQTHMQINVYTHRFNKRTLQCVCVCHWKIRVESLNPLLLYLIPERTFVVRTV